MFGNNLRTNINDLDLQINKLSKEIEKLERDCKYDKKMDKLKSLAELRVQLAKEDGDETGKEIKILIDSQIWQLIKEVEELEKDEVYLDKLKKLEDLTKIRCQLAESRAKNTNSLVGPAIISGLFGLSAMLIVLNYEKNDTIITSKAFGMVTKMFRGV